jgi:hypothetical protein
MLLAVIMELRTSGPGPQQHAEKPQRHVSIPQRMLLAYRSHGVRLLHLLFMQAHVLPCVERSAVAAACCRYC